MPVGAVSISTLLLELKFLIFFRAIDVIGVYFAIIIEVVKSAFSFLIILAFIVFAFAHSLHLLLRPTTRISLDYPSHSNDLNDPNDPWNLVSTYNSISENDSISENLTLTALPTATTNMFIMLNTAILAVYILLTGDSTYLSNWILTENLTLVILVVCFSFFTNIYLMNLFIGLLSNSIAEMNKKELFLLQKAKILAEIELLYLLPYQRRKNNWFPELIVHYDKLRDIIKIIKNGKWNSTDELLFIHDTLLKIYGMDFEEKFGLKT
ncbi:hypothetical protein C2G38_2208066 [Gigaspora rosea]|uniref:Ion transport domain-containing protein n=1 Tax=Gigaspora rosea TaxID=44941 RepID=A0A397UKQ6_9GLOM|nr:hypothetical protein C2G38_2208066 [Gigaspora rosea]